MLMMFKKIPDFYPDPMTFQQWVVKQMHNYSLSTFQKKALRNALCSSSTSVALRELCAAF